MRSLSILLLTSAACAPAESEFTLRFGAVVGESDFGCGAPATGLGPDGAFSLGLNDLRFYVSNLVFRDEAGEEIPTDLDADAFQLHHEAGVVSLVDLTATDAGDCVDGAISFSEGTTRTHAAITGVTRGADVAQVSFDVGVPQAVMQAVIAENTIEGAPSPLGELYWSWATGYRHFVLNATVSDGATQGEGYLHLGSTGCAAEGENALATQDACAFINTPAVAIDNVDLENDEIVLDVGRLIDGLDFVAPVYDPETWEVIGETVGLECHSSPMQPDCAALFESVGLDLETGEADAAANTTFRRR